MRTVALLATGLLLAGCFADPTGVPASAPNALQPPLPPASSTAPAILFSNGCGEVAIFDLFIDGATPQLYLFPADGVVEKPVIAGRHEVRYLVLDADARIVGGRSDSLVVTGPTPYRMTCD